ncbi:MAG TPA: hypothetical protein VGM88_06520 [Kofleriaceae bacterium]
MTVCIVDTSVFVELLGLPGFDGDHDFRLAEFEERVRAREKFLLALPVVLETGNHVAQIPDRDRRRWAEKFVDFIRPALEGNSPFVATEAPTIEQVKMWTADFPAYAMRRVGLVDRSLIELFERERVRLRNTRRIYIWSLDEALMGYDTGATVPA